MVAAAAGDRAVVPGARLEHNAHWAKALQHAGLDPQGWPVLGQDKIEWLPESLFDTWAATLGQAELNYFYQP